MGKFSKSKGKRGELELSHKLRELGFQNAHRSQQYCGSAESADVIGVPGVHIECKRTERLSIYAALTQSALDASGTDDIPVVFHRRNGEDWVVVLGIADWARIYQNHLASSDS